MNIAYPNRFQPWELSHVNNNFWTEDNIIKAVKWLIEDKLKLSDKEVKEKYTRKLLRDNGLATVGMYGIYKSLNLAYPGKYNVEEFKRCKTDT